MFPTRNLHTSVIYVFTHTISGFHNDLDSHYGRWSSIFQRNILPQFGAGHMKCRWYIPPEQYPPIRLCGIITQKNKIWMLFGLKVKSLNWWGWWGIVLLEYDSLLCWVYHCNCTKIWFLLVINTKSVLCTLQIRTCFGPGCWPYFFALNL